jgi:sulfatase modifying factor 1
MLPPRCLLLLAGCTLLGPGAAAAEKEVVNSLGMKLVRIEPGQFLMGSGEGPPQSREEWLTREWDEAPAHRVRISRPFYLGVHEVTNAQYRQFDPDRKGADDEPVSHVTWQQAVEFCRWLAKKEGKPYRLPTEAEWEYACRAGTTTTYYTGDNLTTEQANLGVSRDGKRQGPVKVGSYPANPWGLCDMVGNVAEWCHDWYGPYESGEQIDPVGRADGHARVTRGWSTLAPSFAVASRYIRSANRSGHLPEDGNRYTGFRVVQAELPATRPLPMAAPPLHQQDVKQSAAPKDGPDPGKPHFVSYPQEKKNATIPPNTWGPIFSAHNHYAAVCVCPNGDVLAAWYSTVSESGRECAQAATRLRAGADQWEPASLFFMVPDVNCHAPVLFSDGKRLYHFCTQSLHGWDYAADMMRTSDDSGATWSRPRIILPRDDPHALSQPCSAIRTKDGALILACDGDGHRDERTMLSRDGGQTWKVGDGDMRKSAGRYAIHPALVERGDAALLAFLRGPHPMPVAVSTDRGDSWQVQDTPFPGISVGQKAAALKLASGALLLCSFDNKKQLVGGGTFAALSTDDGKTWAYIRKVDGAGGYMALAQAANGVIFLVGSRMGAVAFNEAWFREGKALGN